MIVCAVSPFKSAPNSVLLRFLEGYKADLVLLPGASAKTPSPVMVQRVIRPGVSVFVQENSGKMSAVPHLVTSKAIIPMPRQVFRHNPSAGDIDALVQAIPSRTFHIGGRRVTFLICGELIAFNPDGSVKHGRNFEFDVIANPAHSMMGHWNHLGRKLSTLSRNSAALYAANNNRERNSVTTDVRIYKHGKLVGLRQTADQMAWCECEISPR